jgi:hypothetical protein
MKKITAVAIAAALMLGLSACDGKIGTTQALGSNRTLEEGWANIERGEVYCIFAENAASAGTSCKWDTVRERTGAAGDFTLREKWLQVKGGKVLCIDNRDEDGLILPDCDWSTLKK